MTTAKLLGVTLSSDLTWDAHIEDVHCKASQRLYFLRLLQRAGVDNTSIVRIYTSLIRSLLEYACQVWHTSLTATLSKKLEGIQKRALRIVFPDLSYSEALTQAHLTTLHDRRDKLCRRFFHSIMSPTHKLHSLLPNQRVIHYSLRRQSIYPRIVTKHERYRKTLIPYGLANWQ